MYAAEKEPGDGERLKVSESGKRTGPFAGEDGTEWAQGCMQRSLLARGRATSLCEIGVMEEIVGEDI